MVQDLTQVCLCVRVCFSAMSSGKSVKRGKFAFPSTRSEAESKDAAEVNEADAAVEGLQLSFGKCMKDLEVGG